MILLLLVHFVAIVVDGLISGPRSAFGDAAIYEPFVLLQDQDNSGFFGIIRTSFNSFRTIITILTVWDYTFLNDNDWPFAALFRPLLTIYSTLLVATKVASLGRSATT